MLVNIENRNGKLFAMVTPADLGLPPTTTMCHIPIPYGSYWEQMGQIFQEIAQSTCPVDTGYLRDHISYHADNGGCDFYSDAPYSAYQEYGTWKMKAQPYFEAAVYEAITQLEGSMKAMASEYLDMDSDLWFLTSRCGREGSLEECYADLNRLDKIIAFMETENATLAAEAGWYYDLTTLYDAREKIATRIQELEEIEEMRRQQGLGGFLAEIIGMMLAQLLMAPLTIFEMILDDIGGGIDYNHYPEYH
jgi:HK97 gp10 family phage protein